jgi:single-stranded DNA-binding protein
MIAMEIIGNLGQDAQVVEVKSQNYVKMSVASTDNKVTTWVSVMLRGDGGKLINYLKKGKTVFVRGRMSLDAYMGKSDNQPKASATIWANEIHLVGGSAERGGQDPDSAMLAGAKQMVEVRSEGFMDANDGSSDLPF